MPTRPLREWGPKLRFTTTRPLMEAFYREVESQLAPFTLYGSGDFHHLAALWLRRWEEPVTVVSFDNHPDWDTRPPHWCCGNWVSRALELPQVQEVHVWGCGNFELDWPNVLFANRKGLQSGRLQVHPWGERIARPDRWPLHLRRENWRSAMEAFCGQLTGKRVYLTVDLDALCGEEAPGNWENGMFTAADMAEALGMIHAAARVVGGDLCGAFSTQVYDRWTQRFAARWDHPKVEEVFDRQARLRQTLCTVWPALIGTDLSLHQVPLPIALGTAGIVSGQDLPGLLPLEPGLPG